VQVDLDENMLAMSRATKAAPLYRSAIDLAEDDVHRPDDGHDIRQHMDAGVARPSAGGESPEVSSHATLRPMGKWLVGAFRSIADGFAAVIGAALCSQMPEYVQQYMQRLGGHRDEAARHLLTLRTQGVGTADALLASAEARAMALAQALDALGSASDLVRPIVFFRIMDPVIARATLDVFRPAVPLTVEGLVYAGGGLLVALLLLHLVAMPFVWLIRGRRRA
jgi:Protein of unknown function (DUF2937)